MTLSLFDAPGDRPPRPVTLVRLSGEIARFAAASGLLAVEGEVHRPTVSRGGWVFFTLRDRAAQVDVKVPRSNVARARTVAGERVLVTGALEWSADRGQLHLRADEVVPVGAGAIAAAIAETRASLGRSGLLDRPRRHLPMLPTCIGVVCGADAAVRRDIESVVAARFPGYPVHVEETTVSGPGAAVAIVDALRRVVGVRGVDVVIVARGGGDPTSLLPWSDEQVCRAVAACPVPVVSAIGHEADRPLCDEVADLRCGTPSMAAAVVVPDESAVRDRLASTRRRAAEALGALVASRRRELGRIDSGRSLDTGIDQARRRLQAGARRTAASHPGRRLAECRRRLDRVDRERHVAELIGRARGRLDADVRHLEALAPSRVLERGYAVVADGAGDVVRDAGSVQVGATVGIDLASGSLTATVTSRRIGGEGS